MRFQKPKAASLFSPRQLARMEEDNRWANGLRKAFGYDPTWCKCGAQMELRYDLSDFRGQYG